MGIRGSGCFCGILRSRKKDKASKSRVVAAAQAARANPRVTDQTLTVANSLPDRLMADALLTHCESGVSEESRAHSEPQIPQSLELPPDDSDDTTRNHTGTGTSTTPRGSEEVARACRDEGAANSPPSPSSGPTLMRRLSSAAKRLGSGGGGGSGSQKRISFDGPSPAAPGVSIVGNATRPLGAVCARNDIHHTATESECAPTPEKKGNRTLYTPYTHPVTQNIHEFPRPSGRDCRDGLLSAFRGEKSVRNRS